ncbi:MAG: TIGR03943 family protein [Candidatus Nanopelagicales bacterium]
MAAVKRDVQAVVLIFLGSALLRISFTDIFLRYVKEGMRPFLIATGAILLVLGAWALWDVIRGRHDHEPEPVLDEGAESHDGHGHGQMRIAWLLLLPVLSILLIAPPALGAYSAERENSTVLAPATDVQFDPLPAGNPLPMSLSDYAVRAVWDDQRTLVGRNIQMTGFATPVPKDKLSPGIPAGESATWWLTRMSLTCCAADANVTKILAVGTRPLPTNTWVKLTGTWMPGGGTGDDNAIPWFKVTSLQTIPQPKDPYE